MCSGDIERFRATLEMHFQYKSSRVLWARRELLLFDAFALISPAILPDEDRHRGHFVQKKGIARP